MSVLLTPSAFQDHPRRCGENSVGLLNAICITGSPPQVRGKPLIKQIESLEGGITPAGAGKTHTEPSSAVRKQDHPRRCGENGTLRNHASVDFGSPPQVRGKRRDNHHKAQGVRITPAGAGKTAVVKQAAAIAWDHPRRCGENYITYDPDLLAQGSPPQVRGKPACSAVSMC